MTALIIVDLQNDFLPGGSLPVPNGNEILPTINALLKKKFSKIIATKDWHPPTHQSFANNNPGKKIGEHITLDGLDQILWPPHCIQGTPGAEFAQGWHSEKADKIFLKGVDENIDSYSGFYDNGHKRSTGLAEYLKEQGIHHLYFTGLATDYCVKYSVLDALKLGFKAHVVLDACQGINLKNGDVQHAIEEMQKAGAVLTHFSLIE